MAETGYRFNVSHLFIILPPVIVFIVYQVLYHGTGTGTGKRSATTTLQIHTVTTKDPIASIRYLSKDSSARCLDGTSPAYYVRQGSGSGATKWIIFFEGGGWCYDLEQCHFRSNTHLGSSKNYPEEIPKSQMGFYVSADKEINPQMYNWNTVYVKYCDGSSFAGDTTIKYKGKNLYFRGKANRDETIRSLFTEGSPTNFKATLHGTPMDVSLRTHNMSAATEVVIAGCSAGALGVFLGIDQIADIIHQKAKEYGNTHITVRGLVDSGYFMDYSSFQSGKKTHYSYGKDEAVTATTQRVNDGQSNIDYAVAMRDIFDFMQVSAGAHPSCLVQYRRNSAKPTHQLMNSNNLTLSPVTTVWNSVVKARNLSYFSSESACMFAAHTVLHIRTPLFLLQPQYDQWQILHIYGNEYTPEAVNAYGRELVASLKQNLFHSRHPGHGAFVDSCSHHCTSCSDSSENTWSGNRVRSTIPIPAAAADSSAADQQRTPSLLTAKADWNEAEAFHVWYLNSLRQQQQQQQKQQHSANSTAVPTVDATTTTTAAAPIQPGVNWFIQDRLYPCADCCKCSVDMAGKMQHLRSNN